MSTGDFAARLVQTAAQAMGMPAKHLPQDIVDEAVMRSAREVVPAILREVARGVYLLPIQPDDYVTAEDVNRALRALADAVEKGDQR